jgi:chromosome segregation ATPase
MMKCREVRRCTIDQLKATKESQQATVALKKSDFEAAQATLGIAAEGLKNLNVQLKNLKQQVESLETIQDRVDELKNNLIPAAKKKLENAKTAVASSNSELHSANAELSAANTKKSNAKNTFETAEFNLSQATQQSKNLKARYDTLVAELSSNKLNQTILQSRKDELITNINQTENDIEDSDGLVAEYSGQFKTAKAAYDKFNKDKIQPIELNIETVNNLKLNALEESATIADLKSNLNFLAKQITTLTATNATLEARKVELATQKTTLAPKLQVALDAFNADKNSLGAANKENITLREGLKVREAQVLANEIENDKILKAIKD